jgi:hypothetical protein
MSRGRGHHDQDHHRIGAVVHEPVLHPGRRDERLALAELFLLRREGKPARTLEDVV